MDFNGIPQPPAEHERAMPAAPKPPAIHNDMPMAAEHAGMQEPIVLRAKQIVIRNQSNPYALNAEMQQLKAEYLQQKFNINFESAKQ